MARTKKDAALTLHDRQSQLSVPQAEKLLGARSEQNRAATEADPVARRRKQVVEHIRRSLVQPLAKLVPAR